MFANRFMAILVATALLCDVAAFAGQNSANQAWRRDPFRYQQAMPQAAKTGTMTPPTTAVRQEIPLKAIILGKDGRYRAVIDNREHQAGDYYAGARIHEISRFELVVEDIVGIRKVGLFHER